ncbi:Pentapeptide repeat-containing protein [Faecalicatena contorta]|uniref:Pentapeptide repeat-containing protein n=2 Tax=Faecalicatena contorta TaxID=39482 RepID=A0A315ZWR6_9FIRM|nr:pentapeptide repeat protein [Faecalicatena contorta]SUQ14390.1 Pentapeptide repeat-containing protein [Faecalicatena contorta]
MKQKYYEDQTFENLKSDGKVITDCEFVDCKFINCTFENFQLSRSILSGCIFQKCSIIH